MIPMLLQIGKICVLSIEDLYQDRQWLEERWYGE